MTILYKICLYEERLQKHGSCLIADSMFNLVFTCLTSILSQMTVEDEIIFFCDGNDCVDTLKILCDHYNVKYKILIFNYKSASKINYESIMYMKLDETHEHIYICEDDYLHFDGSLNKIKQFLNKYPYYFCHPIDYPNLYESDQKFVYDSQIILTNTHHWRSIKSTTCTVAFTKSLYKEHVRTFDIIKDYVYDEHGQNLLYIFNKCFSPIPSLTSHLTNGCIPYIVDTKYVYDENYNKLNL
jgi:hypothetical protein